MDLNEAKIIAESHLDVLNDSCPVEIEINPDITEEFDCGFVFYYNSKEYCDIKDFSKSLAGNGPLLVKRNTGELITLSSSRSVKRSLRELGLIN
ncbi:MAG: YrhB domain-containing protein [Candidatus Thiodiazotropha sp.]